MGIGPGALVSTPSDGVLRRAATAATLHGLLARRSDSLLPGLPSGFRNNAWREQRARFALGERGVEVSYRDQGGGRYLIGSGDQRQQVRVISSQGSRLQLEEDGLRTHYRVVQHGAQCHVQAGSDGAFAGQSITLTLQPRFPDLSAALPPGGCVAPMPGKIVALDVAVGQRVEAGQRLLVMEAMKMEHSVTAPEAGEVVQLPVAVGAQVDADSLLAVVRPCE